MRITFDYRPALRHRTGVGQFAHQLAAALQTCLGPADSLTLFSSSWKDRLARGTLPGARQVDVRVPVSLLNYAWHRLEWPPVEIFTGPVTVAQSFHPLLMPTRRALQFVTIHDLYFLDRPDGTSAEIRRDYPALARAHASRAAGVLVPSAYTKALVESRLGVAPDRIIVCSPGAPDWPQRVEPAVTGPVLCVGTIEPRKNVAGLLRAYEMLVEHTPDAPPLLLAGGVAQGSEAVLADLDRPPLRGRVRHLGYVSDDERLRLYREASILVLPSIDEGFGLPALEAMTIGLPVVAARRGALPELIGEAGLLADPDPAAFATAMATALGDGLLRARMREAGRVRAAAYSWTGSARRVYDAYRRAAADGDRS